MKAFIVISVTILNCVTAALCVAADELPAGCDVVAQTQYGPVCGRRRPATNGALYASFRGIRYARPPLRELRFAEPQPPDSHEDIFDASEHGPICPQYDAFYGDVLQPRSMDEDCLRVNVHTPLSSLPGDGDDRAADNKTLLPVFFFIHGGGFSYGSGDSDLHGPEYLMAGEDVVLVTLNYRVAALGFLSLFSKEIPGNAGLRDILFALEWVQNNIQNFGGDPAQVTIGGQSAGAAAAHLLSISPATQGRNLFNRAIILSGSAIGGFFSVDESYSKFINLFYLTAAGINILKSPKEIYKELIDAPIDRLVKANKDVLDMLGIASFAPVLEKKTENFTTIIPKDPEDLLNEGYGKNVDTWISFCNNESQSFRGRLNEVHLETTLKLLPSFSLPMNIHFASKLLTIPVLTADMEDEYFNRTLITMDKFLPSCTDGYFKYPAMRLTEKRVKTGAPKTLVSEFAHYSASNPFKISTGAEWLGAAHAEDITYFFRVNSILGNNTVNELAQDTDDSRMKSWMTSLVTRFVKTGDPASEDQLSKWPEIEKQFMFQHIETPHYDYRNATPYMTEKKKFFDHLNKIGRGI